MIRPGKLVALISILVASLAACSGTAPAVEGAGTAGLPSRTEDFGQRLAREDHRFLDALDVSPELLDVLQQQDPSLPYSLGRALEDRGRMAAAERSYQFTSATAVTPWAGLAATRQAQVFSRRQDWGAAHAWAVRGAEAYPQNRDAWFYRGEALYRMEQYDQLIAFLDEVPPDRTLAVGENVSLRELRRELALWEAVGRFHIDSADTDSFVRAFVEHAPGDIHSRLYLYLFYRTGALDRFSPTERLLLEGVYRAGRNEQTEAFRLLSMIEPATFLEYLKSAGEAAGTGSDVVALPGLYATVDTILSAGGGRSGSWLSRMENPGDDGRVTLLRARAASAGGDGSLERELLRELLTDREGNAGDVLPEVRRVARDRYLESSIGDDLSLPVVLEDLEGSGASPEEYSRIIDRLLPRLVREGRFDVAEESLSFLPEGAPGRLHLTMVLSAAGKAGLYDFTDSEWADSGNGEDLSPLDYFGLASRVVAGVSSDMEATVPGSAVSAEGAEGGDGRDGGLDHRQLDYESAAAGALLHADALVTAGVSGPALSLAMGAALDPEIAGDAMDLARRFSDLGYHSAALDLGRRAAARGNLSLSRDDLRILYPPAYREEIDAAAARYGIQPALLAGLVREESHFRRDAQSHVGARGLAQLMPATADDVLGRLRLDGADLDNPEENLGLGAFYLDYLGEHLEAPVIRVAAYNAGLGRGRRWTEEFGDLPAVLQIESLPFVETRWYLRRIAVSAAVYQWFRDGSSPEETFQRLFVPPGER
jgi:soluble lytic murein transglycosylase